MLLAFDLDGHFYRYVLSGPSLDATFLDTAIARMEGDISRIFTVKFGAGEGNGMPSILQMNFGYYAVAHRWHTESLEAFTGILEGHDLKFRLDAVVYLRASADAIDKSLAAQKAAEIKKAAKSF